MIGRTVSHYQILDKLGEGGMGVVYKARDAHLDRFVAIKVLPANSVADENRRRRFVQEAKAASALNHPNIVHIYDIDRADGLDYIAMEYVQGRTLDLLIGRKGLKLPDALNCSIQITDALAKAHGAGIVHRDLKPANIMVTPDGLVKVLDFGLAKLTQIEPGEDDATQTLRPATEEGTIVGTAAYMSPEQAEGKPVDARSDIFSFGSVFYEMLTGRRAFRGETKVSTLAAILLKDPKPAGEINAGLPAEVERVLSRCLRKDPARRFQHMDDIKVALSDLKEESVPRRGYRFMAPVSSREAGPSERRPHHAKLVVLPFANLSGDPAQEYFSDGMTEELITELACVAPERLGVIARTSAMRYKGSRKEVARIGRELDVGYIVEGSVRRSGDRVRVSAQLIKVDDQTHVWAQSFDGELRDALTLQSEIARAITQHVDVNLTPGADRRTWRAQPVNPEAYDAYLLGLQQYNRGSPRGFEKADEYFRLAAERHPGFALAYAKAALAYALSAYFGYVPQGEAYPKAEAAARRALEIDNSLTEAHNALATVHWFYHWNLAESGRESECAVRLNPNDPATHWGMAMFLGSMKEDHRGAAIEAGLALSLDPLSILIRSTVCWLPYWARSYDQAIAQARTTLELEENSPQALYVIGAAARAKGAFDEAIAALEQSASQFADPLSLAYLGMTYGLAGQGDQARAVLRRLEQCCAPRRVPSVFLAFVCAGLGENRMALDHLEMAFDERDAFVLWLRVSPDWDLLRGEPRFQQLLLRLDLPSRLTK